MPVSTMVHSPRKTRSRKSQLESDVKRERRPSDADTVQLDGADDGVSMLNTVDNLTRNGRSDAPPPSERAADSEHLMIREVRLHVGGSQAGPAASPASVNPEESFFNTSFQDIGKKLKECNDTLGELQQLGVSHDVQLPELVLVGDQSAGKSSLMSGLANLDLPRSEGTCTRCPLHIRVSRNSDWSCRVWLRKDYSFEPPNDRPINESDVTDQDPFFPWRKRPVTDIKEFKTMHDKSEIEEVLRWAQIAILNDNKPHELFIPGAGSIAKDMPIASAAEETAAKFSPNIVALEIKGPDLPDLSFYDMPGIFQNPADARDDYLVNVVRNLSKAYMLHPSAIIICSMPMNSDAENSSTFGLIRRLNASGRTIGVLTKADLLPEAGNHDQWLAIMNREAHQTGLGYFITSRPQGKDLGELKEWEERMFETNSSDRWPETFRPFAPRCGIERLKAFLSERLGEEFAKSVPTIKYKVKSHLDKVNRQLSSLPELPGNVELEVQTALLTFADSSRAKMEEFMGRFNVLPRNFRDCLLHIKPKFTLRDRTDKPVLVISDDESDAASAVTTQTTPSKRLASVSAATPSKRQRLGETPVNGHSHVKEEGVGTGVRQPAAPAPTPSLLPEPFTEFSRVGRGFRTLRQVREDMQAKTKAGMPDRISSEVYFDLVRAAVEPWNRPTETFLRQTMRDLQAVLDATLSCALEKLKKRSISPESRKIMHEFLEGHRRETIKALTQLYDAERERLLTFNEEAFKQYRDEEQAVLKQFRHCMRMQAAGLPTDAGGASGDKDAKRREAEMAKLGPDPFDRELEVVAYIRGYYRLAALRFADAVSQHVLCRMMPAIRLQLPYYLEEKLGLRVANARDVYERLMEEDQQTARKREILKSQRDKFTKALQSIEMLEARGSEGLSAAEEQSTQAASHVGVDMEVDAGEA